MPLMMNANKCQLKPPPVMYRNVWGEKHKEKHLNRLFAKQCSLSKLE